MAGMTLFNIGLTYGFTSLGDQSGLLLPAAFIETKTVIVLTFLLLAERIRFCRDDPVLTRKHRNARALIQSEGSPFYAYGAGVAIVLSSKIFKEMSRRAFVCACTFVIVALTSEGPGSNIFAGLFGDSCRACFASYGQDG